VFMVSVLKQGIGIDKHRFSFGVPYDLAVFVKLFQLRPLLRVADLFDDLAEFPRQFGVFVVLLEIDLFVNDRHINDMKIYDTAIQTPTAKDFNEDLVNIRSARAAERETEQEDEDELAI